MERQGRAFAAPVVSPYVWSDQFGLKLQVSGTTGGRAGVRQLHGTGLDGGPVKGTVTAAARSRAP
jgi:hypothetical protein